MIRNVFNCLIVFSFQAGGGAWAGSGFHDANFTRITLGFILAMLGFGLHMRNIMRPAKA